MRINVTLSQIISLVSIYAYHGKICNLSLTCHVLLTTNWVYVLPHYFISTFTLCVCVCVYASFEDIS